MGIRQLLFRRHVPLRCRLCRPPSFPSCVRVPAADGCDKKGSVHRTELPRGRAAKCVPDVLYEPPGLQREPTATAAASTGAVQQASV